MRRIRIFGGVSPITNKTQYVLEIQYTMWLIFYWRVFGIYDTLPEAQNAGNAIFYANHEHYVH